MFINSTMNLLPFHSYFTLVHYFEKRWSKVPRNLFEIKEHETMCKEIHRKKRTRSDRAFP